MTACSASNSKLTCLCSTCLAFLRFVAHTSRSSCRQRIRRSPSSRPSLRRQVSPPNRVFVCISLASAANVHRDCTCAPVFVLLCVSELCIHEPASTHPRACASFETPARLSHGALMTKLTEDGILLCLNNAERIVVYEERCAHRSICHSALRR